MIVRSLGNTEHDCQIVRYQIRIPFRMPARHTYESYAQEC